MTGKSFFTDTREQEELVQQLEEILERIDRQQEEYCSKLRQLSGECHELLDQLRESIQRSVSAPEKKGYTLVPDVQIEDHKLKRAWIALYQYRKGATADQIALDMKRHRSTVSTYLNTLVLMKFAAKERKGHEIYYKAKMKK